MTYVTDQTSAELCAHMRKLKAMRGWHEPLADRLWKEVQDLISERDAILALRPAAEPMTEEQIDALRQGESGRLNFVTLREFRAIARAVEAHHGIAAKEAEKP